MISLHPNRSLVPFSFSRLWCRAYFPIMTEFSFSCQLSSSILVRTRSAAEEKRSSNDGIEDPCTHRDEEAVSANVRESCLSRIISNLLSYWRFVESCSAMGWNRPHLDHAQLLWNDSSGARLTMFRNEPEGQDPAEISPYLDSTSSTAVAVNVVGIFYPKIFALRAIRNKCTLCFLVR